MNKIGIQSGLMGSLLEALSDRLGLEPKSLVKIEDNNTGALGVVGYDEGGHKYQLVAAMHSALSAQVWLGVGEPETGIRSGVGVMESSLLPRPIDNRWVVGPALNYLTGKPELDDRGVGVWENIPESAEAT